MERSSEATLEAPDDVLEITRIFDAPRALIFMLWASAEYRVRWWGPEGYALSGCTIDFRIGGAWAIAMKRVDGYEHWVRGVFTDIDEPRHLAFTYVNDEDTVETLVTLDFVELGERTEMRFRQAPFSDVGMRDAHGWGWTSSMDLLTDYARRVVAAGGGFVGEPRIAGEAQDIMVARVEYERTGRLPNDGR